MNAGIDLCKQVLAPGGLLHLPGVPRAVKNDRPRQFKGSEPAVMFVKSLSGNHSRGTLIQQGSGPLQAAFTTGFNGRNELFSRTLDLRLY
jgi:hypothetical protein